MGTGVSDLGEPTHWTYADWLNLPEDGFRYEVMDGVLVKEPPPVPAHASIISVLVASIIRHLSLEELRCLYGSSVGVRLADDSVVIPDLVYIRPERRGIIGPKVIEGAPDLVAEVLSPSNRDRDLGTKRQLYARHGIPEYWIIDPVDRSVTVLTDPFDDTYLTGVRVTGSDELYSPLLGWRLEIAQLFTAY